MKKPSASHVSHRQGFTLIELLVVISVIGILAALLLTNLVGVRGRAADAKTKNDLNQLKKALRLYYNDNQAYPADGGVPSSGDFDDGAGTVYMKDVPVGFTYYAPVTGGDEFLLQAELTNPSDADIAASQTRCNPEGRTYYDGGEPSNLDYFVCED